MTATAGSPADPDASWCVAGHGASLVTGPERALGHRDDVRVRVAVTDPTPHADLSAPTRQIEIAESGVREFTVTWHERADGLVVAVNPAGGNQVMWPEPSRDAFWLTPGHDALVTSVYQRFLVRHLTTTLLERDLDGRSVHAVTAELGAGVLAVAGATCSGKTRLVNHLAGRGLVGPVVDDDCPVLLGRGRTATLVPRRYEVERATVRDVTALVVLSEDVVEVRAIDATRAHDLLEAIPVPWPAGWLPADHRRPVADLPTELPVLEVPARDEDAHRIVADVVASGFSDLR